MEYKKVDVSEFIDQTPIESKKVTLIWSNDGWCYIPQLKLRQKFNQTHYFHETWEGVIAMPEYIEQVTWTLHSKEPRVWQENDEVFLQKRTRMRYVPN